MGLLAIVVGATIGFVILQGLPGLLFGGAFGYLVTEISGLKSRLAEWRNWEPWAVIVLGVSLLVVTVVRVSRRIDTGR